MIFRQNFQPKKKNGSKKNGIDCIKNKTFYSLQNREKKYFEVQKDIIMKIVQKCLVKNCETSFVPVFFFDKISDIFSVIRNDFL